MLTPAQCAARLAIDVDRVRTLIRNGELAAIDVGQGTRRRPRYRVSESALDNFIQQRTVRPPSTAENRRQHRRRDPQVVEFF